MLRSFAIFAGLAAAASFTGQDKEKADSKTQTKTTVATTKSESTTPASSTAKATDAQAKTKTKSTDEASPEKDAKKGDAKKSEKSDADAFHKVTTEFLKQETTLSGVFEATTMTEVIVRPETWSEFTVLEAVEHGAKVKK